MVIGPIRHMTAVEPDPATGKVETLDCAAVHDTRTIATPHMLGRQVWAGTTNGIGTTLTEHLVYGENGQFTNPDLAEFSLHARMKCHQI